MLKNLLTMCKALGLMGDESQSSKASSYERWMWLCRLTVPINPGTYWLVLYSEDSCLCATYRIVSVSVRDWHHLLITDIVTVA